MNASMSDNSGRHIFGTGIIAVLVLDVMELTCRNSKFRNWETGTTSIESICEGAIASLLLLLG
jgi:hypothetical protein